MHGKEFKYELDPLMARWAMEAAMTYEDFQQRTGFSEELVDVVSVPAVIEPLINQASEKLDQTMTADGIVMTCGVDAHTDDQGEVFMICLFNPGLTFQQGKRRFVPVAGEAFWFDDRKPHLMHSIEEPGAFVGLALRPRA